MHVKLHPVVVDLLQKNGHEELDRLVNDLLLVFLSDGFIRKSEIAGRISAPEVYREISSEVMDVFDEITHDYEGVAITGKAEGGSIWINSPEFMELVEQNTEIVVLKSPRKNGIRNKEIETQIYPPPAKDEMM